MFGKVILGLDNISPGESTGAGCIGGMRTYLQDLVTHLPLVLPDVHVKLFTPNWSPAFNLPAGGSIEVVDCGNVPTWRPARAWYEQTTLPGLMRHHKVDVWLGTNNTVPLRAPCPTIQIVQSLQYFTHPDVYSFARRAYLTTFVPLGMRTAGAVIQLSEASRQEVLKRFRVDPAKIRVIHHCLHDVFPPGPQPGAADLVRRILGGDFPYIFYLSAIYPYKNHARLIEAFARIHHDFPDHRLLIAGADSPELGRDALAAIAARFGIASKVVLAGRIPQEAVAPLYRGAQLMAMPTLDETFGLPVLEAMAFGCPVLTSNISAVAEVAGDAGLLVDPFSVDAMAAALASVLGSEPLRRDLAARGLARAAQFSRANMMAKFADVIRSLAPPPASPANASRRQS